MCGTSSTHFKAIAITQAAEKESAPIGELDVNHRSRYSSAKKEDNSQMPRKGQRYSTRSDSHPCSHFARDTLSNQRQL